MNRFFQDFRKFCCGALTGVLGTAGLVLGSHFLVAIALGETGGDDLNRPAFTAERYEELSANSPFTRPLNAMDSYVVTSVVNIDGQPLVTILNTVTRDRFTLSWENNSYGWRLLELHADPDPQNIVARISVNGEELSVRYSENQLSAEALLKAVQGSGQRPTTGTASSKRHPSGNPVKGSAPQGQGKARPKKQEKENKPRHKK